MTLPPVDTQHRGEKLAVLIAAVEAAEHGLHVTDGCGQFLYENAALRRLLAREPERRVLEDAITDAHRAAATRSGTRALNGKVIAGASDALEVRRGRSVLGTSQAAAVKLHVRTAMAEYRVRGTAMPAAHRLRPIAVTVVWVHRCRARRLAPEALRKLYKLTTREVRVAALLAGHAGSREIADALGISPHTARRHAEAVLRKLGVHSRAEVRDRLLE